MMAALNGVALVAQADIDTPLGPLTAVATERGLAGLWFDAHKETPGRSQDSLAPLGGLTWSDRFGGAQKHHPGALDAPVDADHPHIAAARAWLAAYWAGRDTQTIALALDPQGTPFQRKVWQALLKIARGRTSTYGEIAARAGNPAAARAAGAAIGRNPIGIIVPCHRVIGCDGSLTGYAGGLHRKQALLQLEGVLLT